MRDEIFLEVVRAISKQNDIPVEAITMESSFSELGMDSLDGINLINDLEQIYKITIPNEEVVRITSVREAVESLEKLLVLQ